MYFAVLRQAALGSIGSVVLIWGWNRDTPSQISDGDKDENL